MDSYKKDYITYRISRADQAFNDAKLLAENGSWNSSVNRLYYACYYMISALLLQNEINTKHILDVKHNLGCILSKQAKLPLSKASYMQT